MAGRRGCTRLLLPPVIVAVLLALSAKSWLELPARTIMAQPEASFRPTVAVTLGGYQSELRLKYWQSQIPDMRIIALEPPARWTQQAGLRPTTRSMTDYLLEKRGLDPKAVPRILMENPNGWHPLRALGSWLEEPGHTQDRLLILVDPTRVNYFMVGSFATLPREVRARIRFETLPIPDLAPEVWWRRRNGWKDVATGWFLGAFALFAGEGQYAEKFNPLNASGKIDWSPGSLQLGATP